jgi:hypothetical protein
MKSNHSKIRSILYGLLSAVLSGMLWPANEACAQKINDGVNLSVNDQIYFGHYNHATAISESNNGFKIDTHEGGVERPVLWRVMGKENLSNGALTLMSEYVLDTCIFGGTAWNGSYIQSRLNGATFLSNFTAQEQGLITESSVLTPTYDPSTEGNLNTDPSWSSTVTSPQDKFYLPWGTPNRGSSGTVGNKMFWGLAGGTIGADSVPEKEAGLRSTVSMIDNVTYWLRTTTPNSEEGLVVDSNGDTNSKSVNLYMGLRPIFRLDTAKVIYAAEVIESTELNRLDQIPVDKNYLSEETLIASKGSGGSVYKLTVLNNTGLSLDFATSPTPTFDLDEILTGAGGEEVFVKPGDTLQLGGISTSTGGNTPNRLVYKLVDGAGTVARYDDTTGFGLNAINLVARNIYTSDDNEDNIEPGPLSDNNSYTAYLWAQQDCTTRSHEGSHPKYFTLTVRDDNQAPVLSKVKVERSYEDTPSVSVSAGDTATVTFHINESGGGGKYYYYVDSTSSATLPPVTVTAEEIITLALNQTFGGPVPSSVPITIPYSSGKQSFTTGGNQTVTLYFKDNKHYTIYIAAKDDVRNVSNLLTIPIPPYVPNNPPVAKSPVPTQYLGVGETLYLGAREIADDPDLDDPLSMTIQTPSNSSIATASINLAGQLEITGVATGFTTVVVTVDDHTPIPPFPSATVDVTVEIAVLESTPTAAIDYVEEALTNLAPGYYVIGGDTLEIRPGDTCTIADRWIGTTLSIRRVRPGVPSVSSKVQTLVIPARPDAPEVKTVSESFVGYNDGWITGVSSAMEYRPDTATTAEWTPIAARYIENLPAGDYLVRSRAVPGQQFVGTPTLVTVKKGYPVNPDNPIQRLISLPNVAGITLSPPAGLHQTASGTHFTFTLMPNDGGTPPHVRTSRIINGEQEVLTGVANGTGGYDYVIRNVQTEVAIYIGPTVGLTAIEPDLTVWASGSRLYVKTEHEDTAVIYALSGQVVKRAEVSQGTTSIPLNAGIYVVTLKDSGVKRKISVR